MGGLLQSHVRNSRQADTLPGLPTLRVVSCDDGARKLMPLWLGGKSGSTPQLHPR